MRRANALLLAPALAAGLVLAACGGPTASASRGDHRVTAPAKRTTTTATSTTTTTVPASTTTARSTTTTVRATTTTRAVAQPTTTTVAETITTTTVPVPTVTTFPAVLTPTTNPPPPLAQPTAAHPLTILEIGDSLGEDLGIGMGAVLGPDPRVRVLQDAVGDTGLARPDYYDWPVHLEQELQQYHPGVVVVMLGGNDGQSFDSGGGYVGFGTAAWHTIYSERVAQVMDEATQAGAHVLWVGMPIMQDPVFSATMETLNSVYAQQAADHAGVTWFSSWPVFTDSAGGFAFELPDASGQEVLVRDSDGIHIAYAGCERLAQAIVSPIDTTFGIRI